MKNIWKWLKDNYSIVYRFSIIAAVGCWMWDTMDKLDAVYEDRLKR